MYFALSRKKFEVLSHLNECKVLLMLLEQPTVCPTVLFLDISGLGWKIPGFAS
jgi:hypothetical protein